MGLYVTFDNKGLILVSIFSTLIVLIEFIKLTFTKDQKGSLLIKAHFFLATCSLYFIIVWADQWTLLGLSILTLTLLIIPIIQIRETTELAPVYQLISQTTLGLLYCGVFPAFVSKMLLMNQGTKWFLYLLVSIFCSDTLAYFSGIYFGQKKLMPTVSPKKTVVGAFGGLTGGILGGILTGLLIFEHLTIGELAIMSFLLALVGEIGDLFASLIKRVAGVKESGGIMPGHGGLMDRLDGIYFGAPLCYLFSIFFQ